MRLNFELQQNNVQAIKVAKLKKVKMVMKTFNKDYLFFAPCQLIIGNNRDIVISHDYNGANIVLSIQQIDELLAISKDYDLKLLFIAVDGNNWYLSIGANDYVKVK